MFLTCQVQSQQIQIIDLDFSSPSIKQLTKKQSVWTDEREKRRRRGLTSRSAGNIQTWIHTCCQSCWWGNVNEQPLTSSLTFLSFYSLLLFLLSARQKNPHKIKQLCDGSGGVGAGATRTPLFLKLVATDHPHGLCWVFIREACAFLPQPKTRPLPARGPKKPQWQLITGSSQSERRVTLAHPPPLPSLSPLMTTAAAEPSHWETDKKDTAWCYWFVVSKATKWLVLSSIFFFFFFWMKNKNKKHTDSSVRWSVTFIQMRRETGWGGDGRGGEGAHLPWFIHKYIPRATQCLHVSVTMNSPSADCFVVFPFKSMQEDTCVHPKPDSLTDFRNVLKV